MQVRRAESAGDILDIFATRLAVFHLEQGISLDLEIDDIDFAKGTIHLLGEDTSGTIATGRISPPKIGIPADLAEMFPQLLQIAAQVPVIGFYQKLGYRLVTSRDPYLDAGIEHRDLVKLVEPQASVVQFPGRWL